MRVSLPVQAAVSRLSRSRTKSATFGGSGEAFVKVHSAKGLIFHVNIESTVLIDVKSRVVAPEENIQSSESKNNVGQGMGKV